MELFFALFLQLIVSYATEEHSIQLKYIIYILIYTIFVITLHKMGKGAFHLNPDGKLS